MSMRNRPTVQRNPWRHKQNAKPTDSLTLSEIVILRRLRAGERPADIARACGWARSEVSRQLRSVRQRFGVDTNYQILAHPRVVELLEETDRG